MERSMRIVSAVFVLVLLLVATETMGPMSVEGAGPMSVEGARSKVPVKKPRSTKTCELASGKFKGLCFITNNCVKTCKSEGFTDGQCRGFRRRCICSKKC